MARRRKESFLDDAFETFKVTPTWVGPIVAVVVFVLLRFVVPLFFADSYGPTPGQPFDMAAVLRPAFKAFAWLLAAGVLLAWLFAEGWKLKNRFLVDSQSSLASIKDIPWADFERLVCEAYRRKGYLAEVVGNPSGDGGVDVRLTGHGETVLVQCKQWKAYTVPVTIVRELLGVVVSERATRGIVVTSGRFTREARDFAARSPQMHLVDGPALADLIRGVQAGPSPLLTPIPVRSPPVMPARAAGAAGAAAAAPSPTPQCPVCGCQMVLRTARKRQNAGSQFWGCPKYPACRGTRQMEAVRHDMR